MINTYRTLLLLLFVVFSCCTQNDDGYYKNKKNDLSELEIKGAVKSLKEKLYSINNSGKFDKDNNPSTIYNYYFNDEGFIWRRIIFNNPTTIAQFYQSGFDDSNRIVSIINSDSVNNSMSLNYENDPNNTIWFYSSSKDTFIFSGEKKSRFKVINNIPSKYPSWVGKYKNDGKISEEIDYSDIGKQIKRTVYTYDDSSRLTSELVYDSNSNFSEKKTYEYYSSSKITKTINSNFSYIHPSTETEYFDQSGTKVIRRIIDEMGSSDQPNFIEYNMEYDSLGNLVQQVKNEKYTYEPSIDNNNNLTFNYNPNLDNNTTKYKYEYSGYDKFSNWTTKNEYLFLKSFQDYKLTRVIERIIEPNTELIHQKENESLHSGWLYFFGATPYIYLLIIPLIFSLLTMFLSSFMGRTKLLTRILVLFSGITSMILYGLTAAVLYLIFTSFEFPRFSTYWWLSQVVPLAVILSSISLGKSFKENLKELKQSDAYTSPSTKVRFQYYVDYSRGIIGTMSYFLLLYFIFLIFNLSLDNNYFNSIRELIVKYF